MCLTVSSGNFFVSLTHTTTKIEENVPFFTDFACVDMPDCDAHLEEPIFHVWDKSSINIKLWPINNKIVQSYVMKTFFLVFKWHSNCRFWSSRRRLKRYWGVYPKYLPKIIPFMLCCYWTAIGLEVFDVDSENKDFVIICYFLIPFLGRECLDTE